METEDKAEPPSRFRMVSVTFVAGFGVGTFVGVALALLAFLVTRDGEARQANADLITPTQAVAGRVVTPTPDLRTRTIAQQEVHVGPGEAYAVVGTLPRGTAVEVVGRDAGATWLAIRFPAGSAGRGWIPVSDVEGLGPVESLAVALPTSIPSAATIPNTSSRQPITSDDSVPLSTPVATAATPRAGTSTPIASTPAPQPGSPDLVVTGLSLMADGRVNVTVGNRGTGPLTGQAVFVLVRDLATRSETVSTGLGTLNPGETTTLTTTTFRVGEEAEVQAVVDPYGSAPDTNRTNNMLSATLAPAPTPRPTATPIVDTQ